MSSPERAAMVVSTACSIGITTSAACYLYRVCPPLRYRWLGVTPAVLLGGPIAVGMFRPFIFGPVEIVMPQVPRRPGMDGLAAAPARHLTRLDVRAPLLAHAPMLGPVPTLGGGAAHGAHLRRSLAGTPCVS